MPKVRKLLGRIWECARELSGDKAYDRYAQHVRAKGEEPLTPEKFYVSELQRKYSRPSHCC